MKSKNVLITDSTTGRNIANLSEVFDRIKKHTAKTCTNGQCAWISMFMNKFPSIKSDLIATALLNGVSLEEIEVVTEEIKDLTSTQQEIVILQLI